MPLYHSLRCHGLKLNNSSLAHAACACAPFDDFPSKPAADIQMSRLLSRIAGYLRVSVRVSVFLRTCFICSNSVTVIAILFWRLSVSNLKVSVRPCLEAF